MLCKTYKKKTLETKKSNKEGRGRQEGYGKSGKDI